MKFFETSKYFYLKKSTYINLRWIAIIGQLVTINLVYFFFGFEFNFIPVNIIILIGILSNLYLVYFYEKTQLLDKIAFFFLFIDIISNSLNIVTGRKGTSEITFIFLLPYHSHLASGIGKSFCCG